MHWLAWIGPIAGLDAKASEFVVIDHRKGLGVTAALEIERLVFDAVDMNHLPWA